MKVFRLTPKAPLPADPEPVPILRVKGTGHTEMELWPAARSCAEAIPRYADDQNYDFKELDTKIWTLDTSMIWPSSHGPLVVKPYVVLQAACSWAEQPRHQLPGISELQVSTGSANDFVILYGVNHPDDGQGQLAASFSLMPIQRWLGVVENRPHDEYEWQPGNAGDSARYLPLLTTNTM
jgi:hypothetical protein